MRTYLILDISGSYLKIRQYGNTDQYPVPCWFWSLWRSGMSVKDSPYLTKWISEFCAPVIATITTNEVELICQKNGLLFHELLSAFGRLDTMNAVVRTVNATLPIVDAHIRFERVTEVQAKSAVCIEEHLRKSFVPYDIISLPNNIAELKVSPPNGSNSKIEDYFMRSMSFSEFEMISQPLILMTVISTSDVDPVACMQELTSLHHTPPGFSNGQYDPDVHRVYVVLHDPHVAVGVDPIIIQRIIQSKFPPHHTKLLMINSLSETAPNLHQPDMWSRYITPLYFPQHAPTIDKATLPNNPMNNMPALGCYLSIEDFMTIRGFCVSLFQHEVVPCLERRIGSLTKIVKDNRKGVQNVLKSFWRKPREDIGVNTRGVRYRYDRIESQILLLADCSFIVKDYENALSMYKLVKDDYSADKSTLHLAHTTLMIAVCTYILDTGRRDVKHYLESLSQLLRNESHHFTVYFALIASELYVNHSINSPLDGAYLLLQAATKVPKLALTCGLLTEKAAIYFLQAGYYRKYALHVVLAGHKIRSCGEFAIQHTLVCFLAASILYDRTCWGDAKAKLIRALAEDLSKNNSEDMKRILLLYMRIISFAIPGSKSIGAKADATSALRELLNGGPWGYTGLIENWNDATAHKIVLDPQSIIKSIVVDTGNKTLLGSFPIPEVDLKSVSLLSHSNASKNSRDSQNITQIFKDLLNRYDLETQSIRDSKNNTKTLADFIVEYELQQQVAKFGKTKKSILSISEDVQIPLGDDVIIEVTFVNRLTYDLSLQSIKLNLDCSKFDIKESSLYLHSGETKAIKLFAKPLCVGKFRADSIQWTLSNHISVNQTLLKPGSLIHSSLSSRINRERKVNKCLDFEIIAPQPVIEISFDSELPSQVYDSQIVSRTMILHNTGAVIASNISIISSNLLVNMEEMELLPTGSSSTIISLPVSTVIAPGEKIFLKVWLRLKHTSDTKIHKVPILVSYFGNSADPNSVADKSARRTSTFYSEIMVMPSLHFSCKLCKIATSTNDFYLVVEVQNCVNAVLDITTLSILGNAKISGNSCIKPITLSSEEHYLFVLPVTMPNEPSVSTVQVDINSNEVLFKLINRYLSMEKMSKVLDADISKSRISYNLKAVESNEAPRSIQQVREANREKLLESNISNDKNLGSRSNVINANMSLNELASFEWLNKTIKVLVSWRIRGASDLFEGIKAEHSIPVVDNGFTLNRAIKHYGHSLHVGIKSPTTAHISPDTCLASIPVELQIYSTLKETVIINVDGVSTLKGNRNTMQWEGKSKYVGITVHPAQLVILPFTAVIAKRGVYDLLRFKITSTHENNPNETPAIFPIHGENLVEVL